MTIDCPHWSRTRDRGQGSCALGRFNGAPWPGNCLTCLARDGSATPPPPPPREWPMLLRPLKLRARAGDRGLGDIVAREVGPVGGDVFKAWFKAVLGRSCGCEARQEALNQRYLL